MQELFTLHDDGTFSRAEALEFGYDDRALARARRDGLVVRIRHGAYASAEQWNAANPEGRHFMLSCAVLRSHPPGVVALSHVSSAVAHGLPMFLPDLQKVHLLRLDKGTGRNLGDVVYHTGRWQSDHVEEVDGRRRTVLARAAVEVATLGNVEQGVVALDGAIFRDESCQELMKALAIEMVDWPHGRKLQICARLARKGAQSVGETRSRFLCFVERLPEPELQHQVWDESGNLVAELDFWWPQHRVFGEFDGEVKYGRLLRPGEDPSEVVFREKRREDRIREITGALGIRWGWRDLDRRRDLGNRIRAKLAQGLSLHRRPPA